MKSSPPVPVIVALIFSAIGLEAQGQMQAPAPVAGLTLPSPVTAEAIKAVIAREAIRPARQEPAPPVEKRVRITAGSDVELPGVFRIQGKTMSGPILSGDPDVVTVRGAGGQPVTLARPGHKIVGNILEVSDRTVTVARDRGSVVTVPRSAIAVLERSNGKTSRMRRAGRGFLIGGGGGAGIGFLYGRSRKCAGFFAAPGAVADQPCFLEPEASTVFGLIFAGGGGALIGALAAPGDRWVVVPLDWLTGR